MNRVRRTAIVLASGGMLACCFHACAAFVLAVLSHGPVPVPAVAGAVLLASLATGCHHGRGWRRISVFGVQTLGMTLTALWVCHVYYGVGEPFWRPGWVPAFFGAPRDAAGWSALIAVLGFALVLWTLGRRLVTRPPDPGVTCLRFDTGLGCLLGLLLIKLLVAVKGGSVPVAHSSVPAMTAGTAMGLFAMGLVRTRGDSRSAGTTCLKGAGVAMIFAAVALLAGGGATVLFLPELQSAAQKGAGLLGGLAGPAEQVLVAVLRLLLERGVRRGFDGGTGGAALPGVGAPEGGAGVLQAVFTILCLAILMGMIGVLLHRLLRWLLARAGWLFAKTDGGKSGGGAWERLVAVVRAAGRRLRRLWASIFHPLDLRDRVLEHYRSLLRWGRFSGSPQAVAETPAEYGRRLGRRFPRVREEIDRIVRLHDATLYGCIPPERSQLACSRLAVRKIRSPLLWPDRIRSAFFPPRD